MNILDCCEEIEEARLILMHESEDEMDDHYTPYPRIEAVLRTGLEKLVGHDFCQQILREDWLKSQTTGHVIQWQVREVQLILTDYSGCRK